VAKKTKDKEVFLEIVVVITEKLSPRLSSNKFVAKDKPFLTTVFRSKDV